MIVKSRIIAGLVLAMALLVSVGQAHGDVYERNAQQVRRDIERTGKWGDGPFACYVVPAISSTKRLPSVVPDARHLDDTLRVIAARDSFESASFVIFPFSDLEDVELHVPDLEGPGGEFPADRIDVRLVKSWYKGGTAWHSYFTDPDRRTLVPELLLNDQDLIRVDEQNQENYLRIDRSDGPEYQWVSYPQAVQGNLDVFNHATEPVQDAEVLLPFRLHANRAKQVWVTVDVPSDASAGLYRGRMTVKASGDTIGELDVRLRVLPFVLPSPEVYHTTDQPFYTLLYNSTHFAYYRELLGDDAEAIERHVLAEMENMRRHNVLHPLMRLFSNPADARRQLQLGQEAGLPLDAIFSASNFRTWRDIFQYGNHGNAIPSARLEHLAGIVEQERAVVEDELGHRNMYAIGWDEPGRQTLRSQQPLITLLHDEGLKYYTTAQDWHLKVAGFNQDAVNLSGKVFPERARPWRTLGTKVFAYSYPHTGPENPEFIRRTHGLRLYKRDYDGTANYRYYGYRQNPWNDFTNRSFRIRLVYPTSDGVVDTLHWAGLREGVDDVRYATKLRTLALRALDEPGATLRHLGGRGLRYLALLDEGEADLNHARLEMIHHILELREALEEVE